jgi:CMP-N,N'-diacetyllegionaminic acid synthase
MKQGKITAVVAVRKGSQRIPNKNIKPFGDSNLLEMKLNILKKVPNIDEIIVNSDCNNMLAIGKQYGCLTHKREDYYASSIVNNSDFHEHIAKVTETDFIFLTPTCSPFISVNSHKTAIEYFLNSNYDSLTSIDVIKNHLWLNGKPLNYDLNNIPNSQDLPDVKRLNYGISIIARESMLKNRSLIGNSPDFYELDHFESVDVDTPFDFFIAEQINNKFIKNKK